MSLAFRFDRSKEDVAIRRAKEDVSSELVQYFTVFRTIDDVDLGERMTVNRARFRIGYLLERFVCFVDSQFSSRFVRRGRLWYRCSFVVRLCDCQRSGTKQESVTVA